jgi:hypothetical protein
MRKDLIEHKKWLSRTFVISKPRSPELKAIDGALKAYELSGQDRDLDKIRTALAAWKQKEFKSGHSWKASVRNKDKAFEELGQRLDLEPVENSYTKDLKHSRLGLLYLFSDMEVESGLFEVIVSGGLNLAGGAVSVGGAFAGSQAGTDLATAVATGVGGLQVISSEALQIEGGKPPASNNPKLSAILNSIKTHLESFAKKIWDYLTSMFKKDANKSWINFAGDWWSRITGVINTVLNQVSSAAPFVGAGFDIVQGTAKTVIACYERYQTYSRAKGVDMNDGHPAVIVKSIEQIMNLAIGEGLYQALKGAASAGAAAASAGAAAILSIVVAGCELIAKVVYRLWEASKMKAFFADCKDRYTHHKSAGAISDDDLLHSGIAFGAWYRAAAYALPCLSALALCSGMTGDKMMYLSMFKDQKDLVPVKPGEFMNPISKSEFERGVPYIDKLKETAKDYLSSAGFKFSSTNRVVEGLLRSKLFA